MNSRRVFSFNFLAEEVSVLIYGLEGLLRRPDLDEDVRKCAAETLAGIREDANRPDTSKVSEGKVKE